MSARAPAWAPAALALALAGAASCESAEPEAVDLSALDEPEQSCVRVTHEALDIPDIEELHGFVADASGTGGWALVTRIHPEFFSPQLAMVRVPASPDEANTEIVGITDPNKLIGYELRRGAELGELWLLNENNTAVYLRRLRPGLGAESTNGMLANFPAIDPGGACPEAWQRQLLLVEGRPYILALPNCSDNAILELQLLELDPDDLSFTTSWLLAFDPCAGVAESVGCTANLAYRLAALVPGSATPLPSASRVSVAFAQLRAFNQGALDPESLDVANDLSMLDLRITPAGPQVRLLTFRDIWLTASVLPPERPRLAQDPYSTQILMRTPAADSSALFRLDTVSDHYLQTSEAVPFAGEGELVQLRSESAMMLAEEGELLAIPLVDVDGWPQWQERVIHELEGLVDFESAGPGDLLLRREDQPPQVIHVDCLEP